MENLDEFLRNLRESPEGKQFIATQRMKLFKELHEIVFYGKGGYNWETVYHLPLWLRRFIYSEINKHYRREADAINKANSGGSQELSKSSKAPAVRKPDVTVKPRK